MAKQQFQLKPSLIAIVFQLMIALLIVWLLLQMLTPWLSVICIVIIGWTYFKFVRANRIVGLDQLDDREWSISYLVPRVVSQQIKSTARQTEIQRVELHQVIDHQIYIVLEFQQAVKPVVIWCDQVSKTQWKALKVLAKMF
ncbi:MULTISPECIES: hypothetical protein [Acinetobacter]|uniref:Uncharacterized protein n=1 Tax=Acinetobacter towneri TaxID=202956 RepID=A0A1E8E325_9GAMM|nr:MULTISPECIES: hypothetical protein [Acinetobacter]MDM1754758.1 hypothetical protein [Acinetobacter towneri]OFE44072.1 hypothetical protein BJN41_02255 [Acinetobacter towneri]